MNINLLYSIILNIIICSLVNCSTFCSIFVSLNCSCFQSNFDLHVSLPIKTYSHLYCQGNVLNKKTFKSPFGLDFKNQNRFRTISIEFFLENQVEIQTNQFDSLALLFSQTNIDAQIEISIRFNGFTHITFNQQSLTSNIYQQKHLNKRLSLHFIPKTLIYIQNESGEDNSTNQFKFSPNSFSGLIVSQLNIFLHTLNDHFSSLYPFEYIFNNTNIGELHFHGSIIPPGSSSLRRTFKGLVRSLTLHRHVDTIDSNTFPYYFPVYSYNIHSIEAHSMDLDSFVPLYNNLRGLELIRPRFEVSIDKLIPTLDSLTLDIEYLNERTLLSARHIYNLKLGSRLRRINPQVLYSLSNRLKYFDLSEINLSEMTSDSRCHLIQFISDNYQRHSLNINLPRIESLTECDCARLILNNIQLMKKSNDDSSCSRQCRFSDCLIISQYFREKDPLLLLNHNQLIHIENETNNDLPYVDLFSDRNDVDMMSFLINQTNDQQININQRQSTTIPSLIIFHDPNYFSDSMNQNKNELSQSKERNFFSWKSFLIGGVVILVLILIISSIIFCSVRHKKQKHFIRVPVYV